MASKQRPPSSDSSSSSESEEEQVLQRPPPPAKKPSLKSTSPKTKPSKPSKSLQKPSSDDEEDEDGEPAVSQKKDQKKKEVSMKKDEKVKKDEKENEEEGSSDEEDDKQQEEEDEDDDNDEGTGTSDEEKQQLSKKPDSMAISASGSEPEEKPAAVGIVTPAVSGRKRPRDSAPSEPENTEKKKPFMRIWEVDDEIKILKAIIAFYSDKGTEFPSNTVSSADLDAIHSLLKKSLGLEFTKGQLGAKIRGLRRKFRTNASHCKNNTDPKFSNPQRQEIFELSKQIWWPDNPNPNEAPKSSGKSVKSKGKSALKVLKDQEEEGDPRYELMWRAVAQVGNGDISLSLIKRGLKLVDPEKARHLEKRFFKLELARMRHCLQWLDKREEAIQLVIDSMKKSG
ncbi:hypothetical protein J5N97_013125 [Dioscorea zingiberensis]|uniref:Glabrous enhancer-binding protein-like DBD domain-containing protein n=1 Tax=Dioscorea zingiberensis TaxID=325984 RepID=A0A9D5CQ90_9LILI|nr:hypothetical protein J5N97_013125 [Dioscorea zingiberensis]